MPTRSISVTTVFYRPAKAGGTGTELREYRKLLKQGNMIPWMTTGYSVGGGSGNVEYPPEWVYDYVLEAYGSGVRGIYWFAFFKFESSDFYYHARAMDAVNPVADSDPRRRPAGRSRLRT